MVAPVTGDAVNCVLDAFGESRMCKDVALNEVCKNPFKRSTTPLVSGAPGGGPPGPGAKCPGAGPRSDGAALVLPAATRARGAQPCGGGEVGWRSEMVATAWT